MKAIVTKLVASTLLYAALELSAATRYVDLNSASPTPPFISWATAATNIQDAIDASMDGDLVLVTNGVYATGGRRVDGSVLTNRVAVTKAITVQSVNGAATTSIVGYQVPGATNGNNAVRCVYLADNATLIGFTLTNGATRTSGSIFDVKGGGLACASTNAVAIECIFTGNAAYDSGGGTFFGTLISCSFVQNSSRLYGGGAAFSLLVDCVLEGNSSGSGGAVYVSDCHTCTFSNNRAGNGGAASSANLYSCNLTGNRATDAGAAISSVLRDCWIEKNTADNYGGAINGGTLSNCVLNANTARYGGASYGGVFTDCHFSGNRATNYAGAAAFPDSIVNSTIVSNVSLGDAGGVYYGALSNCTISGNTSSGFAGGAFNANLTNCLVINNAGTFGGGVYQGTVYRGLIGSNSASSGGGMRDSTAFDCVITGNSASDGGGSHSSRLENCVVQGNTGVLGGGSYSGSMRNCSVTGNFASNLGGGAYNAVLTNCTVTANSAGTNAGGTFNGSAYNSIIYFNTAPGAGSNYAGGTFRHCFVTPLPTGTGNSDASPLLATVSRISSDSPCRGSGSTMYATGKDIDGEVWGTPPAVGCDEFYSESVTGSLAVALSASYVYVPIGFEVQFVATILGNASDHQWDFGDGNVVSNQLYVAHSWTASGDYIVTLTAYNETWPSGVSTNLMIRVAAQPIHYVAAASSNPVAPYDSWQTAAVQIQDAINVAAPGAVVLVTNGTYATGGKAWLGGVTNRIAVDKALSVRSVNGPEFTSIQGYHVPGTTNGITAIRCAYLADGSTLAGFTLSKGATWTGGNYPYQDQSGGGVWCMSTNAWITNCIIEANTAEQFGGGVYRGTLNNCIIRSNYSFTIGGAAFEANLNECLVLGNYAPFAGGVAYGSLKQGTISSNVAASGSGGGCFRAIAIQCKITGNSAHTGGGDFQGFLTNCIISHNQAGMGGGSHDGTLFGCTLVANEASSSGAGASYGTLISCAVIGNSCGNEGGGCYNSTLYHCTLTGNSAEFGGGTYEGSAFNSIVYFNSARSYADNYYFGSMNYTCTTPLSEGDGNIDTDPLMASAGYLSVESPCIGAGSVDYASAADIDSEPWGTPPTMGCDEFTAGAALGDLSVAIAANYTNVAVGFEVKLTASILGHASANRWSFGDGSGVSNRLGVHHLWTAPGDYPVILTAYNDTWPSGASVTTIVHVVQANLFVSAKGTNPVAPFSSWQTAATNLQDALDAAAPGSTVWVTNGTYASGGKLAGGNLTNRVAVDRFLALRSVNGPEHTLIRGYQMPTSTNGNAAVRCAYLATGATLAGFTLTEGATLLGGGVADTSGGGIWCESKDVMVSNCVIVANSARNVGGGVCSGSLSQCQVIGNVAGDDGGGCYQSDLESCVVAGNYAGDGGGGCYQSVITNSTIVGNTAHDGGGVFSAIAWNSIIQYNQALSTTRSNYTGGFSDGTGSYDNCCTAPQPPYGINFTNEPGLMNTNGWADLRLQPTSACINAGQNAYVTGATDLDGNPRIAGGTVDIGAYEYQAPASKLSYAWLQQYGLSTDGSADFVDTDGDGMNNYGEWRSDTVPTNALSALKMVGATMSPDGATVRWESVITRSYWLERATNLAISSPFQVIATNLWGDLGTTTYSDATATTNGGPYFYRVGVQ